ncbi:MAG: type II toxin-antitoxin system RelE/ParE family toxin [Candidatus Scalindua sp.]
MKIEKFVFEELPYKLSISESGKIEKLSGFKNFYKVRFGMYRLGIESKNKNEVLVIRTVMHRREIYKYFP